MSTNSTTPATGSRISASGIDASERELERSFLKCCAIPLQKNGLLILVGGVVVGVFAMIFDHSEETSGDVEQRNAVVRVAELTTGLAFMRWCEVDGANALAELMVTKNELLRDDVDDFAEVGIRTQTAANPEGA